MIAALGLVILPAKRRRAQEQFHARAEDLQTRLMATLREQFAHELDRSLARIGEAVAPYTRFVRAEAERMEEIRGELRGIQGESDRIRYAIDALAPEMGALPAVSALPAAPRTETQRGSLGLPPGVPVPDATSASAPH